MTTPATTPCRLRLVCECGYSCWINACDMAEAKATVHCPREHHGALPPELKFRDKHPHREVGR